MIEYYPDHKYKDHLTPWVLGECAIKYEILLSTRVKVDSSGSASIADADLLLILMESLDF